jgi:hypothetical protein
VVPIPRKPAEVKVLVAVPPKEAVLAVSPAENSVVLVAFAKVVLPVRFAPEIVGEVPKTSAPLPVSSVSMVASSLEVSIEALLM